MNPHNTKKFERDEPKHIDRSYSTSTNSDTSEEVSSSELDLLNPRPPTIRCHPHSKRGQVGSTQSSEELNVRECSHFDPKDCEPRKSASSFDLLQERKEKYRRRTGRRPAASRSRLTRKHSQRQVTLEETELSCGDVVLIRRKAQYFDDDFTQGSSVLTEEEYKHITAESEHRSLILLHSDNISENKEKTAGQSWWCGRDIGCGEGPLILVSENQLHCETDSQSSNILTKSDSSDLDSSLSSNYASHQRGTSPKLATSLNKQTDSDHQCEKSLHGMQTLPMQASSSVPHQNFQDPGTWHHATVTGTCPLRDQSSHSRQEHCGDQNVATHQFQRYHRSAISGDMSTFPPSFEKHDYNIVNAKLHTGSEESSSVECKEMKQSSQMDSKMCSSKGNFCGKEVKAVGAAMTLSGTFPFQGTPSGNLKIIPNQVVYESQKMSVLVANPKKAKINVVKDSGSKMAAALETKKLMKRGPKKEVSYSIRTEPLNVAASDSLHHMKLYPIAKQEDTGDGASGENLFRTESECLTKTSDEGSDAGLSRMLFCSESEIEWSKVTLPGKSHVLKLLEDRIKNFVNPDIIVCVENNQFSCHHLVLQCYSTYFDKECEKIIELPPNKVTTRAFSLIYDWMIYSGQDSYCLLRRDNILEIFMAAQYLGIRELEEQCWAFIDSPLIFSEATAFMLYLDARRKNNEEVAQLMIPRITTFFLQLVASHDFLLLSLEDVCNLLSSNYIQVNCEMQVFMSAVRWLTYNWTARASHVVEVMKCVRFGWILPWQLVDIRRNPANPEFLQVTSHPEVMQMMEDGVAFAIVWYWYGKNNEQECYTWVRALDLKVPQQRNWDPKKQDYSSYQEFVDELDAVHKTLEKKRRQIKRIRRLNPVLPTGGHNNVTVNICASVSNAASFGHSKNFSNGGNHKSWLRDSDSQRVGELPRNTSLEVNGKILEGCRSLSPRNEAMNEYPNGSGEDFSSKFILSDTHDFPSNLVPPSEWLKNAEDAGKNSSFMSKK